MKEIPGVGTFQDAGPLENNPLITAKCEVKAMFPLIENPDFVLSLGTGAPKVGMPSLDGPRSRWKDGALWRYFRMSWEKSRDRKTWHAFEDHPGHYRLDIEFDDAEPRLDDATSMHQLKSKVQGDCSFSKIIDSIARRMVASLFYLELESLPERHIGGYRATCYILCLLGQNDPAFKAIVSQLSSTSACFYLNDCPILGDRSVIDKDGNFRKRVELNVSGKFTISFKQGDSAPYKISGSPFSIEKLALVQGLNAHFSRADHRKRKGRTDCVPAQKRRRTE